MAAYTKQTWDTTSVFNPTRMNHIEQGIYDASTNIVDNLTSTDATTALSAKQGKVLNEKIKFVTGTLAASGLSDGVNFPTGMTKDNSAIVNFEIQISGTWRSGAVVADSRQWALLSDKVYVWNDNAGISGSAFRVSLMKIS